MLNITPLVPKNYKVIEKYGNGGFVISREKFTGNILILPTQVINIPDGALNQNHFSYLKDHLEELEVLLVGTGSEFMGVDDLLTEELRNSQSSIDAMDTGAACRTYNVLLSEGRKVAAILIAV